MEEDVRDIVVGDLAGFDAVIHLAGLSNDPLGDYRPNLTQQINCEASVNLARLAKKAGCGVPFCLVLQQLRTEARIF